MSEVEIYYKKFNKKTWILHHKTLIGTHDKLFWLDFQSKKLSLSDYHYSAPNSECSYFPLLFLNGERKPSSEVCLMGDLWISGVSFPILLHVPSNTIACSISVFCIYYTLKTICSFFDRDLWRGGGGHYYKKIFVKFGDFIYNFCLSAHFKSWQLSLNNFKTFKEHFCLHLVFQC